MNQHTGTVIKGINTIYTIAADPCCENLSRQGHAGMDSAHPQLYICRIKGKKLKHEGSSYNPLAPGDRVLFSSFSSREGLITARITRRNSFVRWNMKRSLPQILGANLDAVLCITSPDNPPFRPRFIDRVIVCAADIPVIIVLNKSDLGISRETERRLRIYADLGYRVIRTSCLEGEGLEELTEEISGLTVLAAGQSGVGKSSLVNSLIPQAEQRIGLISEKFNRGRHVTNHAVLCQYGEIRLIDTPGVRELQVPPMPLESVDRYFPELSELRKECRFISCLHRDEPDCAVRDAVELDNIDEDRYVSYLRILEGIEDLNRLYPGGPPSADEVLQQSHQTAGND